MYRKLINIVLFLFVVFATKGQEEDGYIPCDYIPLEFEEIKPLWSFLVIDSTFIGHLDTSEETGQYYSFYDDGMEQFNFDGGSFIHNNFLYSITSVFYEIDLSGYFVQKIDLESKEVLWEIRTDLRHTEHREKAMQFKLEDGKFSMIGVRTFQDDRELFITEFDSGFLPAVFFKRVYNDESGELISYSTSDHTDDQAAVLYSRKTSNFLFEIEGGNYEYIKRHSHIDKGYYLDRVFIDSSGYTISNVDTVIVGSFNYLDYNKSYFRAYLSLAKSNDSYFFLDQFMPLPEYPELERRAKMSKYDKDFNLIKTWDFANTGLEKFSLINIAKVIGNKIILHGCNNTNPRLFCEFFYVVLDTDLNFEDIVHGKHNGNQLTYINFNAFNIDNSNHILGFDREILDSTNSNITLYKSNNHNSMDSLIRMTIKQSEWTGYVDAFFILDNGNYLVKINHSCLIDGRKNSFHPEWMIFAKEDLNLLSSTINHNNSSQVKVFPNPSTDYLQVSIEDNIEITRYEILNFYGQKIKVNSLIDNKLSRINISNLSPGSYILRLYQKKGNIQFANFIKQ